ncbi:MAG TPA: LLM class F420-dependent oxidoreductase [Ardenticatenaceae bacterium]
MIEVAIMLEGQMGLNWVRLERIARAVEALGFVGLYRSDHFTNPNPPDEDSLELWLSLGWLASHTERIEFGPLVSPVSFRDPAMTARMAIQVDNLSNGRLTLGVGAGWQEREHESFGYDLLGVTERLDRFEEGLEVITRLLRNDEPSSYEGEYYHLKEALLMPRPEQGGRPPILIGGNGPQRTLPLVARYADEWNAVFLTPQRFRETSARLDELLEEQGRQPGAVRRSLMTGLVFGRDKEEVRSRVEKRSPGRTPDELREHSLVVGTVDQIVEQLGRLAEAGVQRVMLQWLDLDDLDGLETMAQGVLPQIATTDD